MLELRGISKREDGLPHLTDVSLTLRRGEFNLLLGESLAGKTSLLRTIAGLDKTQQGRVLFDGQDMTGVSVREREVAMVYQEFVNYPGQTVFANISSPLVAAGMAPRDRRAKVLEMAELLGLGPFLDRRPAELSGGQQQRVALARALVKQARLILLDEPLANLDYKLRDELRDELPRLLASSNAVMVYATSNPIEALIFGGKTAVLHQGKISQFGPTAEVFAHPQNLQTARIFADPPLNIARGQRQEDSVVLEGGLVKLPAKGSLAALPAGECTLAFRPHHLELEQNSATMLSFSGRVQIAEFAGSGYFVHVRAANHDWVAHTSKGGNWPAGSRINLYVDPQRLLAFDASERLVVG